MDGREGLLPLDESLAVKFRKLGKAPVLIVNKMDEEEKSYSSSEFLKLGFKHVVLVSAEHGYGIEKLSKLLLRLLPSPPALSTDFGESRTRIAFIGRPNVGKSSLCNRLLNMERLIVSDVPGTTRETVELDLDYIAEEGSEPFGGSGFLTLPVLNDAKESILPRLFFRSSDQTCN